MQGAVSTCKSRHNNNVNTLENVHWENWDWAYLAETSPYARTLGKENESDRQKEKKNLRTPIPTFRYCDHSWFADWQTMAFTLKLKLSATKKLLLQKRFWQHFYLPTSRTNLLTLIRAVNYFMISLKFCDNMPLKYLYLVAL